jgi:hypothetical protein
MLWACVSVRSTSLGGFDERKQAAIGAHMTRAGFVVNPCAVEILCYQDGQEHDQTSHWVPRAPQELDGSRLSAACFAAFSRAHSAITDMRVAWQESREGPVCHRLLACARAEGSLRLLRRLPAGADEEEEGRRVRLRGRERVLVDRTDEYAGHGEFVSAHGDMPHF